ncbi:ArpU family phage packaging/lysis transcriptional regulator [Marinilactibacillus sp. Marseille-P9653]|uniref:ArpU family phage packaging/lysis transcriptional regulator n=1 Tax=Marinilactibacillus sp. Marseille-P9653 TaxID=2866583 RepID=UPI001CE49706|nr:ArpU family phage packaging/lysis transcriptional regulator [Marinilactibacillus sp. Marseille-P9653]
MLELFMGINKEITKDNADELMKLYRRLLRMADKEFTPKMTATYSFEPKSYTGTNPDTIGDAVTRKIVAQQELNKIVEAINKLNSYNRQLLYLKYMNKVELSDVKIYTELAMSESTFYRELEKAQLELAEAYEGGELLSYYL